MKNNKNISVVIPIFNEEESIEELAECIIANLSGLKVSFELIFIDDGSTDNSMMVLSNLFSRYSFIKIYKCRKNFGKANALNVGFKYCSGEIIITMDGDLQDDPYEIPKLLKKLEEGYDLVSGWKINRKDPWHKTLPSKIFNFVTSLFAGIKLHDFNCGFKAYKRQVIKNINLYGELHRYIPAIAHWKGFKVTEIGVKHHQRKYGKSKYGIERFLRGFLDFTTVAFITKYITKPMHFFGKIGFLFSMIGFFINLYLTIIWIIRHLILGELHILSNRPLLFLGILLLLIGIQFIFTGLIGEMLIYLHREQKNEIEGFVIDEIYDKDKIIN